MSDDDRDDGDRAARLHRLLGGAELAALRRRLRARYERGEMRDAFTLADLGVAERRALEALLGRGVRSADSMRLTRSALDDAVRRAGLADTFRAALEALDGPLPERRALAIERALAWQHVVDAVSDARLRVAVGDTSGLGVLKRLASGDPERGRQLLEDAVRVLARLPARGLPLARLAAEALGDAHALDDGQPVAALVLRACAAKRDDIAAADEESNGARQSRRARWAAAGVTVNELALPALVLNLRARGASEPARLANIAAELGSPVHLSLRALLRNDPAWQIPGNVVHVCENPSIVAIAADALGADCRPLVCTDGMPAAAQQTVLQQLAAAGCRLLYHGDFDWPGLVIGNFVMRGFDAQPWRFRAADYRAAPAEGGLPLARGRRVPASWDAALADAMEARAVAVHEEALAETLLSDLADR